MKKPLSLLVFLLFSCLCTAQSPYEVSWGLDGPLLGSGIGVLATSHFLGKKMEAFDESAIGQLRRESVGPFDRSTTYRWSTTAQKHSDILVYSSFALPTLLLADSEVNNNPKEFTLIYLETLVINTALTNLLKNTAKRTRPYVYNPDPTIPFNLKLKKDARRSFFSGHTSTAASMSFLTARMYSDFHPDSKARPYIWAGAAIIPAATGYLRVRGGKHFPTDVITGYVVGSLLGIFLPALHK
ncbi:MAG: phosphatase PAP2 family protein [Bacteroidota bacterium]